MKQKIEDIIFKFLKANLPDNLKAMLVKGHSNLDRPIPYICIDCFEQNPFGELDPKCGLFELTINISIADSAHDIDYNIQADRGRNVMRILEEFEYLGDGFIFNYFGFEEDADARDENNIGTVLKYSAIVQTL